MSLKEIFKSVACCCENGFKEPMMETGALLSTLPVRFTSARCNSSVESPAMVPVSCASVRFTNGFTLRSRKRTSPLVIAMVAMEILGSEEGAAFVSRFTFWL